MKKISIVASCYNEEGSLEELYTRCLAQIDQSKYDYEFIFIDNHSEDRSPEILRELARRDKKVKVILNARNFGHIRSPFYAITQATGDAVITMASDLEEPPELLGDFISKWENGYKIVVGMKNKSEENPIIFFLRNFYYFILQKMSEPGYKVLKNFTGFGLYDKRVIDIFKSINDPYPYIRGIVSDIGFDIAEVYYERKLRPHGITKNNFYTLYDLAMLGFTKYSKIPLRMAVFTGFLSAILCFIIGGAYLLYKIICWQSFNIGMAPIVIGLFFIASIQLFFLGILGEYICTINTKVHQRPLVVVKEKINFDE